MRRLLEVLHRLTDLGNTVIIIEHNLDVIRNADWILDLGPEGGEGGGQIVAEGTPEQIAGVEARIRENFCSGFMKTAQGRASVSPVEKFSLTGNGSGPKRRKSAKKDWVQ